MIDPGVVLDKVEIVFSDKNLSYFRSEETMILNR